jgi:hypothetical protein
VKLFPIYGRRLQTSLQKKIINTFLTFFYGALARFWAMASPTFFLHYSIPLAAAFQFQIQSRLTASLCMAYSYLFHGLPTSLPPPKQLPSTFFGI